MKKLLIVFLLNTVAHAYELPNSFTLDKFPKEINKANPIDYSIIGLKVKEGYFGVNNTGTAVVIAPNLILTAAHNLFTDDVIALPKDIRLYDVNGSVKWNANEIVEKIFIPKEYNDKSKEIADTQHDVALVKLKSELFPKNALSTYKIKIAGQLNSQYPNIGEFLHRGDKGTLYGFGWGSKYKEGEDIFKAGHFACQSSSASNLKVTNIGNIYTLEIKWDQNLNKVNQKCPSNTPMYAKQGDSGGAIFSSEDNKVFELVGILSQSSNGTSRSTLLMDNPVLNKLLVEAGYSIK